MKYFKKRKVLSVFALANIISLSVNACGTNGYGTIGSYLFGAILQQYSLYIGADVRVQEISQKNYVTSPQTIYYPQVYNTRCSLTSGNNLTMMAYNTYATECMPLGNSGSYLVDCVGTWTVGYNAHLKVGAVLNYNYKNPDAKSPMSGGVDFTLAYDYSSSASGSQGFYCSAMGSTLAGY
ncbi:MAG: hypothetical protein JSS98_00815 [Bacteroidetes bacterium]|nr:hypothetical protein [Bacteroidota bacterium]